MTEPIIDVSEDIAPGEEPLCPICDQPIGFDEGKATLASAQNAVFLIHDKCAEKYRG